MLDAKEAAIGFWEGDNIYAVWSDESRVPSKHGQGGQSKVRFERNREIAKLAWLREIAERASTIFLQHPELTGILVGGPGMTKDEFLKDRRMHYTLLPKILAVVDNEYTMPDYGLKEAVERYKSKKL